MRTNWAFVIKEGMMDDGQPNSTVKRWQKAQMLATVEYLQNQRISSKPEYKILSSDEGRRRPDKK